MTTRHYRQLPLALLFAVCFVLGQAGHAQPPLLTLDLPAQPLELSVTELAQQANLVIGGNAGLLRGKQAPALRGEYTAEQALRSLLEGSGLTYRINAENSVVLEPVSTDAGVTALDPIKVYGAKNVTTVNDATASVGVVTGEEIERRELRSVRDTFRTLANVMDADWTDAGFVIRGINSEGLTPGGAPLASLYVDGARQTVNGARRGTRGLWDVEQVEVYRGPQSTLTGRAALAGAVYVKTKDPSFQREQKVQLAAGNRDMRRAAFVTSGPLIENELAFRLAAEYEINENDINYPDYEVFNRFDDYLEDEYYQIRGKLLWMPQALPNTTALLTYAPRAWTYELAYKGHFDRQRLRISAALFHTDWDDQQVEVQLVPGDFNTNRTTNAAQSTLQGFELEAHYAVTDALSGFASIGYVDTEFDDFNALTIGDVSGEPFPEAPEWNGAVGAYYEHASGWFTGVDAKYTDSYLSRLENPPHETIGSRTLVNAQLGYRTPRWSVTAYAENALDKEYFVYRAEDPSGQDIAASLGEGRMVGVSLEASF